MIKRDGILAGLNLREVAKEAGVTRGLLYHHFGSRAELLKASLVRDSLTRADEYDVPSRWSSFGQWAGHWFRTSLRFKHQTQLLAVVHLDTTIRGSDESTRIMHRKRDTQSELQAIIQSGRLIDGVSAVGIQTVLHGIMFGHSVVRRQIARELRIGVKELDATVAETVELLFDRLERRDACPDEP